MSFTFEDRESTYPNRYKVIPENGEAYYAVLQRADEPTRVGTPLNAKTFNELAEDAGSWFFVEYDADSSVASHTAGEIIAKLAEGKTPVLVPHTNGVVSGYFCPLMSVDSEGGNCRFQLFMFDQMNDMIVAADFVVDAEKYVTQENVREIPRVSEANSQIHVIDTNTTDTSTVDFSQFAVGDVILVTTS